MSATAAEGSRPDCCSSFTLMCSKRSFSLSSSFNFSRIRGSPSNALHAANLKGSPHRSALSSTMCSTAWIEEWMGLPSGQKSCSKGVSQYFAMWSAWVMSSPIPWFFAAEIGTTGTPRMCSIRLISTEPPLPVSSSIMLRATTTGRPVSRSCIVRYRLRSIFVESTILIMASGLLSSTKSRETISSLE